MLNTTYGLFGCSGGFAWNAWNFSRDWGNGLDADYPYTATDGTCKLIFDSTKIAARAGVATKVKSSEILSKLEEGPLAIAISAYKPAFSFYKSGIITSADGCPHLYSDLDHELLLVGYGLYSGTITG